MWPWRPRGSGCEERRREHRQAMREADRGLAQARARQPEVRDVSERVAQLRRENGFAEAVRIALEGHP